MKIGFKPDRSKMQQLIEALMMSVTKEQYKAGDFLPSINQISKENSISRDTVFKAYQELKRRGMIDSTASKGYYVKGTVNKVFMLLDTFSPFKDVLYNSVVKNLSKNDTIDLLFHHYNLHIFDSVIHDSLGRYNTYVVMNFNNDRISDTLKKIDPGKLLVLDWGKYKAENYAYVCQDFDQALYDSLKSGWLLIRKYKKLVLYFPDSSFHPQSSIRYFKRFCKDHHIDHDIVQRVEKNDVEPGTAYLVIPQKELVEMVRYCKDKNYTLGRDVGLIGYNDTPVYEIIDKGITVISTDFAQMGKRTADFIKSKQKIQEIIPTRLMVRGTL